MTSEIRNAFHLLSMETQGQVRLTRSLLSDFDIEVLEAITHKDDYIDNLKTDIENNCFSKIYEMKGSEDLEPLNQVRALHIMAVNLERIADFCVNIARQTRYLSSTDFIRNYDYQSMFQEIESGLVRVSDVFERRDLSGALAICRAEFKLDDLWDRSFSILMADLKKGDDLTNLITTIFIFRYLERIGDAILNIGEALIFAIMGDRIKIRQVEALEKTLTESGFKGGLDDIDFASIWGSRSGCRITKVSRKKPSAFKAQGIFKEGRIDKIQQERSSILRWEKMFPGLVPRVFGYYEKYQTAAMLVEYLPGCTLDQVVSTEKIEVVDNVVFVLEQTLLDVWFRTLTYTPGGVDSMTQLAHRLPDVIKVHPTLFAPENALADGAGSGGASGNIRSLISACRRLESRINVPFTVLIHGDFNTNNVVYNPDEQQIHYIDLHRSRDADYVQDASVFLVSNIRMPAEDPEIRERLYEMNHHFFKVFQSFAREMDDGLFEARMALALARSLITSMRFEADRSRAAAMLETGRALMASVTDCPEGAWAQYRLPLDFLDRDFFSAEKEEGP